MKKIVRLCLSLIGICVVAATHAQTTGDYRSAASGNWSDASTWQRFDGANFVAAPGAPSSADGLITIRSGHTVTVNTGVTTDQTVVALGGILTQTSTLTVADGAGNDITVTGAYNFLSGTVNGAGTLVVNGSMDWQLGDISTNIILSSSAVSGKSTGNTGGIQNGVLTNNGAFTWSGGAITLGNGTFANSATGVITATGDNTMNTNFGAHNFANTGTFTKNGGAGTTNINVNGSNSGTINVTTGIINYNSGGFINTGTINSASGKKFTVSGGNFSLNTGSNSTGAGNFELAGGSVTVNASPATATNYLHSGGTINGPGTFQINSGMDWQLGDISTNVILGTSAISGKSTGNTGGIQNGVLTNNGAFNWSGGTITLGNGTFANGATGVITATGDNTMNNNFGAHNFANAGTFTKNGGAGTTNLNVAGSNSGTINVITGIINYNSSSFANTGTINSASGKKFTVSGGNFSLNTGSKSTGAGNFETAGGSVTVNAPAITPATATNYLHSGGTINGLGTFLVNGGMDWQLGNISTNIILGSSAVSGKSTGNTGGIQTGVLTNNGAFNWSGGAITLGDGIFTNSATGVITVTGDNVMNNNFGSHNFANAGTFTKNGSTGTTTLNVNGSNSGTINVTTGVINYSSSSFANTGTINSASGKKFTVSGGNFSLNTGSKSAGAGNFELAGGSVTVNALAATPATATNYLHSGGTINGPGTFQVNGGMDWQLGDISTNVILGTSAVSGKSTGNTGGIQNGVLTNNGAFNWSGGAITLGNGTFANGASGIITATGDNTMNNNFGTHNFANAGTFTKNGGTGNTNINVNGSNSGTITVTTGIINYNSGGFINTGTINSATGKKFTVSGGNFSLNTGSKSTGAGNFELAGGSVTVNASPATATNYLHSGGTINGLGTFQVNGGMDWQLGDISTNVILGSSAVSGKSTGNTGGIQNGILTNNGVFSWSAGAITLGNGTFTNTATGVITATGDNTMNNNFGSHLFANAGTFAKSNVGTTTIAVSADNTGSIKGIGTMNFAGGFTSNGIIAPGTSPGLLTINGAQPLSANSTLNIELLNGSGAGTGNDQLSRDGSLTLAGMLTVVETGFVPAGIYTIVNCTSGTLSGIFASVNLPPCYTLQVNSTNVQVTKTLPPTPTITASGPRTFCQGGSVTLTSSAATGNTWSNGATTQSIVVTASGNFTVTFTNAQGCTSLASSAKSVTVNPLPAKPVITSDIGTVLVCPGKTVTLTSTAATTYLWSTGETTQSIIIVAAGSYSVAVTNASGCTNTSDATVVTYDVCAKPIGLSTSNITATSARINWMAVTCAVGYQFEWRVKGTIPYSKGQTTGITRLLTGLLPNTTYQWRVITGCKITPDTIASPGYTNGPEFTTLAAAAFTGNESSLDAKISAGNLSALIMPNPAKSIATLKVSNATGIVNIKITDLSGKIVWQNTASSQNTFRIDVSHLAQGTYMVMIKDERETKTMKLVKE